MAAFHCGQRSMICRILDFGSNTASVIPARTERKRRLLEPVCSMKIWHRPIAEHGCRPDMLRKREVDEIAQISDET